MSEQLPRAITRRTADSGVVAWLVGLAVVLPVVVPAMLESRWSFGQRSLVMFAGFCGGRLVQLGVTRWRRGSGRALRCLASGAAIALIGFGAVLSPLVKHQARESHPPFVPMHRSTDSLPADPPGQRPGTWKAISINDRVACAIRDDATVWCWGHVAIFGDQRTDSPRQVAGLDHVSAVSVGLTSACALVDHHVWCFGSNYDGSVGVPPVDSNDLRREPVRVPIAEDLVAVSAGDFHTCALAASGNVWCWGMNNSGEIGSLPKASHGALSQQPDEHLGPTRVQIPAATAIAAGDQVSCAVGRDDGNAWCWGAHDSVTSMGPRIDPALPTVIPGLRAVTQIAAGRKQICVLAEEAPPTCWGLAAGRESPSGPPDANALRAHAEAFGAQTLSVGHSSACAVLASGEARCWGDNRQGELGNGRVEPYVYTHELEGVRVVGVPKLVTVAAGGLETCGLTGDGQLWCWGREERRN